jgi:hypothetical protein
MKSTALLAGAAIAGLLSGSLVTSVRAEGTIATQILKSTGPGTALQSVADNDTNSCKGKNTCKGKGGCKTSDNGCKGKNSCKGKGGCATDGSKS